MPAIGCQERQKQGEGNVSGPATVAGAQRGEPGPEIVDLVGIYVDKNTDGRSGSKRGRILAGEGAGGVLEKIATRELDSIGVAFLRAEDDIEILVMLGLDRETRLGGENKVLEAVAMPAPPVTSEVVPTVFAP